MTTTNPRCPGQFNCYPSDPLASGDCVELSRVCNFYRDCESGLDEAYCGTCTFDDNDMCGWTNIGQGIQQWAIQPASIFKSLGDTTSIPKVDSSGDKLGSFLIIDTSKGIII